MERKLRWGILGTGNIARQFAEGVRQSRRGELAAVGSRTAQAAQKFAGEFGAKTALGSYEELIAAPSVDAVYVSLPNTLHHAWTIAALRAGKHVLCEKPIGANAKEAEEMFDAAQQHGRVLVEAFMYRSHPLTLAIVDAVKRGDIGELRVIRTAFCFRTTRIEGNIRFSAPMAGGSLMDVGCYCINFSRLYAGCEPSHISGVGRIHASGIDEYAAGTLQFPSGVVSSFVSGMTVQCDNTAYLCGTEGYIEIPVCWKPPTGEAIYYVSQMVPPRMNNPSVKTVAPPGSNPKETRRVPVVGHLYGIEADDFAAAALDGATPRLSRQDSVGNMRVLDELRQQIGVRM